MAENAQLIMSISGYTVAWCALLRHSVSIRAQYQAGNYLTEFSVVGSIALL